MGGTGVRGGAGGWGAAGFGGRGQEGLGGAGGGEGPTGHSTEKQGARGQSLRYFGGSACPWPRPDLRAHPCCQEKRKRQAEAEAKRRQLEDDRRQLQHLKVPPHPVDPAWWGLWGRGAGGVSSLGTRHRASGEGGQGRA